MKNIFSDFYIISDSAERLDEYLSYNMQYVYDVYYSDYDTIKLSREEIERFVLLRDQCLSDLNFENLYVKSFILILLDLCERLDIVCAIPILYDILNKNKIEINARMQAALSYIYPKPKDVPSLVAKYDDLYNGLQYAVDNEEDNSDRCLIAFLNYYAKIVSDTSKEYRDRIYSRINDSIKNEENSFLKDIENVLSIDISDREKGVQSIQNLIDDIVNRQDRTIYKVNGNEYIEESNTEYVDALLDVDTSFNAIRNISVQRASSKFLRSRGVSIIESEEELYIYLKQYGNMHRAKLEDAMQEPFPQDFESRVDLIDWGCGQGLASMIFLEKYGADKVNHITLIEPSKIALGRASLHCKKYNPYILIRTICKKIDEVDEMDIKYFGNVTIHLFSNVLDLDDYNLIHLVDLIGSNIRGINYFICVSPYITDIKSGKVLTFVDYFRSKYDTFDLLKNEINTKNNEYWCCNNKYKSSGIFKHGIFRNCLNSDGTPCDNRWTRIMEVFSISC